jgi:hypothetical protein
LLTTNGHHNEDTPLWGRNPNQTNHFYQTQPTAPCLPSKKILQLVKKAAIRRQAERWRVLEAWNGIEWKAHHRARVIIALRCWRWRWPASGTREHGRRKIPLTRRTGTRRTGFDVSALFECGNIWIKLVGAYARLLAFLGAEPLPCGLWRHGWCLPLPAAGASMAGRQLVPSA